MRTAAVIVAAGSGERLGAGVPKALVRVAGLPMVAWSARAFAESPDVECIVIACPPGGEDDMAEAVAGHAQVHAIVPGGTSRQRSVAAALAAVPDDVEGAHVTDTADGAERPAVPDPVVEEPAAAVERDEDGPE